MKFVLTWASHKEPEQIIDIKNLEELCQLVKDNDEIILRNNDNLYKDLKYPNIEIYDDFIE